MKLADLAVGANTLLAERAVREPVLDTLLGVTLASGGLSGEDECESLFVAYAMMRISQAGATPVAKPAAPATP